MTRIDRKQLVYDFVVEGICNGSLPANSAIVEQELSTKLNVSRTPVREALRQLEQDGLVTHFSSQGTFVKEVTEQDITEIYELRILFETCGMEKAVVKMSDAMLDDLERMLRAANVRKEQNTPDWYEDFYAADAMLHRSILSFCQNTRMIQYYNVLNMQIERLRRLGFNTPGRPGHSLEEHLEILNAVRTRDAALAKEALSHHLKNVYEAAIGAYRMSRM